MLTMNSFIVEGFKNSAVETLILRHIIIAGEKCTDEPDKDLFMLISAGTVIARIIS